MQSAGESARHSATSRAVPLDEAICVDKDYVHKSLSPQESLHRAKLLCRSTSLMLNLTNMAFTFIIEWNPYRKESFMPPRISDELLIPELERVTKVLKHPPSHDEMKRYGCISPHAYQRRFGSWEEVKRQVGWIPAYETFQLASVDPSDGAWLSGLIDGEGCFRIQRPSPQSGNGLSKSYAPVFNISFRTDDLPMLQEIRRIIGVNVHFHLDLRTAELKRSRGSKANPAYKLYIRDLPTLAFHLIPTLELYPLRSKKRFELPVFKFATNILLSKRQSGRLNKAYTEDERTLLESCYQALHELKQFQADHVGIAQKYGLPQFE